MRIYKLIEASGYTSETGCRVYKDKSEAIKDFVMLLDGALDCHGEGCFYDDIQDKMNVSVLSDKFTSESLELYKSAVKANLHFRYDIEVIEEVWIEEQEV